MANSESQSYVILQIPSIFKYSRAAAKICKEGTTNEEGDLGLLRKTSAYSETIRNDVYVT
jgi:hypothetical protein